MEPAAKNETAVNQPASIGPVPKAIYLTVGPSGAGKDTLLKGALKKIGDDSVVFCKRHITRDADKCEELENPVTKEDFERNRGNNMYMTHWDRHDTLYGIPYSEIQPNKTLILNVSRGVIEEVNQKYTPHGTIVRVLRITASDHVLRERLVKRSEQTERKMAPEEIEKRIKDGSIAIDTTAPIIQVLNDHAKEEGIAWVAAILSGVVSVVT
eukprot:TRINITY_DN30633_c0_g1_i1.p1 TRINITY_DN30633_c0_g1~~TRINITY_DN30633_c0_g1_i1.p1  ORF type:complete len:211 (+),score=15.96 TRINITY_DN30633_c0_g1_i1:41-673(+)